MKKMLIKSLCFSLKCLFLAGAFLLLNFDSYADNNAKQSETTVQQQQKVIKGTVLDENKKPLPGVSVAVKGQTRGTATDINGRFEIKVKKGDVLVISFVGMESKEVTIADQKELTITLEEKRHKVDEVIVVAYGTVKKESFTGSAVAVGGDEISKTPIVSVDQALAGTAAGVSVSGTAGQPGNSTKIRIRGTGSINSSNEPLYILDGVALMNDNLNTSSTTAELGVLSSLNPNDIESISILKDAAAAALYGSRAANGVIIITTKGGKTGKTKFSLKSEFGYSDFAVKTAELASSKETFDYKVESYKNFLMEYKDVEDEAVALQQAIGAIKGTFPDYDPDDPKPSSAYDWEGELFRTGAKRDIQFSASGGNDKTTFFASLGYVKSEGVAVGSDFERYSGRLNLDHKANDFISMGFKSSLAKVDQNTVPSTGLFYVNPLFATRYYLNQLTSIEDENGEYNLVAGGSLPNLVKENKLTSQNTSYWENMNQGYIQLNILEGLSFKSTNSLNLWQIYGHKYWSPQSGDGESLNGYVYESSKRRQKLSTSNILTYVTSFNDIHNLDILVGYEAEKLSDYLVFSEAGNLPNDEKTHQDVAAEPLSAYSNEDGDRMQSVFSRINYNYDNKYYGSLSYRTDASSRLGSNNRWGNFWSVSGSWRLSEEEFLKDITWIDDWKIRASYGINGTLPSSWVGALGLYEYGYDYNGVPGSTYMQIENADLQWEKNHNFSIATEFRVFNFLNAEIEYFSKKTKDLLLLVPTSKTTGFSSYWDNVGEMTNKGIEISLSTTNISTMDFVWTSNLTLTHYENTVDKLEGGDNIDSFPFILREGESFSSIYVRDWAGVDPETGHGTWYVLEDEKRVDKDEDGKYDITHDYLKADKKIVGNTEPLFEGSLSNYLSFNNFDLSFMFTFKVGFDAYNDLHSIVYDDGNNIMRPILKSNLDHWKEPGDISDLPKVVYSNPQGSNNNSSRRVMDASYLRLKNISLGYTLPKTILRSLNIESVRVYASAVNLLTISELDDYDPETTARGVILKDFDFPPLKTYSFGIQVNF